MRKIQFTYHWRCLIGCLFFNIFPLYANHYYFQQLSLKEGVPAYVKCILTEKKGFVWIGSNSGLGRFDGYELKQYIHHTNDSTSLPHNSIYQIIEDKQHNIWVLTKAGVAHYQSISDDFRLLKTANGRIVYAQAACLIPEGIAFGCQNKIIIYDYKSQSLNTLQEFAVENPFIITSIIPWDKETLLCSDRWRGMLLVNIHTGKTTSPPFKYGKDITDIFIDSQERLWTASYSYGIDCFSRNGNLLATYNTHNSKLSSNIVLSITERDSLIWIGTDGGGINILDPLKKEITVLEHIPGDNYSLPVNSIRCLYNDGKNMWAGSIRGGLINIREVSMTTYKDTFLGHTAGLSNSTVLSIYEEATDKIWIGTDGGGINLFNPVTKKFRHFPTTWGDKVVSITSFSENELLISIFTKGLFIFNKTTGISQQLVIINEAINKQIILNGKTTEVYQNTPETFLLMSDCIYLYNKMTQHFYPIKNPKKTEILGTVLPIYSTPKETYLYSMQHILRINHQSNQIESLFNCSKDTVINSVTCDGSGIFWIGDNYGLSSYNSITQKAERIPTPLFNHVKSVVYDRKGKLWLGTADGMVFAWLIKVRKFVPFGKSDGVILNEYINKAHLLSISGNVYLGGINGLLEIDKDITTEITEKAPLQLIDIKINGVPFKFQQTEPIKRITIPWDTQMFTVKVLPYGDDIFREKIYRFQVMGPNNQNIDSHRPELTIRSLPTGTYHILASYTTRTGDWTSPQQMVTLIVMPPWYKSWWFIFCLAVILLVIITLAVFFTIRRKESKLKWTMKEHEKQVYEEKVRFLINISHELRTPLTLIYGSLSRMLKHLSINNSQYASLKRIYKQAQRMKDLINMVLDVRKIEVGGSQLLLRPQELNVWVEQIVMQFVEEAETSNVQLSFLPDKRIEVVSFDANKCEIVLTNLLINALKHSPQNSQISISTEIIAEGQRIRIAVSDQGKGLKEVDPNLLFTRFYQGNNEQEGTGIGLSYAKILVELHGGSIGATDNHEAGATFFFELPLVTKETEIICQPKAYLNELIANTGEKEKQYENIYTTSKYSILLVDDNKDFIAFLKESFDDKFNKILTAKDGQEAIILAKQYCPDIIVSDVMMPRKNGYELCREIKETIEISHIPVILLTARNDQKSELQGYNNGADAYLSKPFEVENLWKLINSQLYNRELIKSYYQKALPLPTPENSTISQADETFLLKLNMIISENMEEKAIDLDFLCQEIGMSRSSLYKKLKALTGISPNDYINKLKIEKAIVLITTTNLSFTEISELTGFTTPRYFSTAFKLYTQKTPTQYKKEFIA